MSVFSDDMSTYGDATETGLDFGYPDYSNGTAPAVSGGFQVSIPSGVTISAGATNNQPSVPLYPSTAPAIYQTGAYSNTPNGIGSAFSGGSMILLLIVAFAAFYIFAK